MDTPDETHARGRVSYSLIYTPMLASRYETPVPPLPVPEQSWAPIVPPSPKLMYNSQSRTSITSDAGTNDSHSEFKQKREDFLALFDNRYWNLPGEELDGMDAVLEKSRALVVGHLSQSISKCHLTGITFRSRFITEAWNLYQLRMWMRTT